MVGKPGGTSADNQGEEGMVLWQKDSDHWGKSVEWSFAGSSKKGIPYDGIWNLISLRSYRAFKATGSRSSAVVNGRRITALYLD